MCAQPKLYTPIMLYAVKWSEYYTTIEKKLKPVTIIVIWTMHMKVSFHVTITNYQHNRADVSGKPTATTRCLQRIQ